MQEDLSCDPINDQWVLYQLRRGHRYSSDDLLTAWLALKVAPKAIDIADIGSGIGTVGLLTLWNLSPEARLVMVEAQQISHQLARKSIQANGLTNRVKARLGDLRDPSVFSASEEFDLVTGTPPYFPVGTATASAHPQRAACRMELRGSILDYALTAARLINEAGWFVCCHCAGDERTERAMTEAGLHIVHRCDVVFRAGKQPTIVLLACQKQSVHKRVDLEPMIIRDENGLHTEQYLAARRLVGRPSKAE